MALQFLQTDCSLNQMDHKGSLGNHNPKFDYLMKVIIIGDSGVGKSNILLRYSQHKFVQNYLVTIGINYLYRIEQVEGARIKIQIWDTAGQDKYKTITRSYYNGSNGILVVYAVNCRLSFKAVKGWMLDLEDKVKPDCQILLIANKTDIPESERQVSESEGKELARQLGVPFFECSAKTGNNIQEAFSDLGLRLKRNVIDLGTQSPDTPIGKSFLGFKSSRVTLKTSLKYQVNSKGGKLKGCKC